MKLHEARCNICEERGVLQYTEKGPPWGSLRLLVKCVNCEAEGPSASMGHGEGKALELADHHGLRGG